jgi:hypothetical protein
LGPSLVYANTGLIDPRLATSYFPGAGAAHGATGWMVGTSAIIDAAPSVNAANNIAASQVPVAGTAVTLVAATAAGVTVGISVQNATTLQLSTGNIGLDVSANATNGNFGKILFGQASAIKIWDPANLVARNIVITSVGNDSAATFTVRGFDAYNYPMTETITGANATVANGVKAWKYITSITPAGTLSGSAITIGTGNIFGLPLRADFAGQVIVNYNNTILTALTTFVAAVTSTASATTGDVRGTIGVPSAPDGTKRLVVYSLPSVSNLSLGFTGLTGVVQF